MKLIYRELDYYQFDYRHNENDKEFNDSLSILYNICENFEQCGKIFFEVGGFGQDSWPVDCRFDLLSVIEQVPDIVRKIRRNQYNFVLDFYEQGIERKIVFKDNYSNIEMSCESRLGWNPDPKKITMDKEAIKNIFIKLYEDFLLCARSLCKNLIEQPLLKEWMLSD